MGLDDPIDIPESLRSGEASTDLLSTYWPSVVLLVLGAAAIAFWLVRRRRRGPVSRRRAVLRATGATGFGALALVLAVALGVNTWVGYIPSVEAGQRWVASRIGGAPAPPEAAPTAAPDHGAPAAGRVTSADAGHAYLARVPAHADGVPESDAWVYVPPDYDKPGNTRTYPVVYALHGAPGTAADWFSGGQVDHTLDELITGGYLPPVILVAPDLNAGGSPVQSEPLDLPGGPQLESFVVQDVVAWTDATLRTRPDAQDRIIAGMSAGGFGALVDGLHHPDVFGGVIALLPYTQPYTDAVTADPAAMEADTPASILQGLTTPYRHPVFLAQGNQNSQKEIRRLHRDLKAAGVPTTMRVYDGLAHNWTAARTIMPYGLVWVAQQMQLG